MTEAAACSSALGGKVLQGGGGGRDLCSSTNVGTATDGSNTSCAFGLIAFQPDGTLLDADVTAVQRAYPGCF